ncbi:hypothetical protein [Psychrobacter sp. M13]|uniref:hypothetical protein n=1 Tax=Psychrobacter sp. M13 TaxID=3067275 RepID=UPI00273B90B6|nr:hypothetical protein [Psychrobacter sp. M13]WLP95311.1 hypothetical protein Q9G97_04185 [Psychrobacter sp. M13]
MVLLRLLADILLYLALGSLAYWYFTADMTALLIAIASGVISFLLFMITTDIRQSQHKRKHNIDAYDIWNWWFFVELLEIPLRLLVWLLKSLWRVFD